MLTIDEVRVALSDRNLREVARRIGVSYPTLWRIATGKAEPSYQTLTTLSDYLRAGKLA